MSDKPTYEELEQQVRELEKTKLNRKHTEKSEKQLENYFLLNLQKKSP